MSSLKRLEESEYSRTFFKLPQAGSTFYIFDTYKRSQQPSYWNLVGVRRKHDENPLYEIQFLYIDEEALNDENFSALRDASSFLNLQFEEFQTLTTFLEQKFDLKDQLTENKLTHFFLMSAQDLAEVHFTEREVQQNLGNFYYYSPPPHLYTSEKVTVMKLPSWVLKSKTYVLGTLAVATFDRKRLEDPTFHIFDAEWLGSIQLDVHSLGEFVSLLKQRAQNTLDLLNAEE